MTATTVVKQKNGETQKGETAMSNELKLIARIAENLPEMSTEVRQRWIDNPKALQKFLFGLCPPADVPELPQLFRKITTVQVNGTKKLVIDQIALNGINVGWTGDNFKKHFLGRIEENVEGATIAVSRLERDSVDAPIMAELGIRVEGKLCYLFDMLKKQSNGEDGPLLTHGHANIIYVMGDDGNLCAVGACWDSGDLYWDVEASSVGFPCRWLDGSQVLSRDS